MNVLTMIGAVIVALWLIAVTAGAAFTLGDALRQRRSDREIQSGLERLERWVNQS